MRFGEAGLVGQCAVGVFLPRAGNKRGCLFRPAELQPRADGRHVLKALSVPGAYMFYARDDLTLERSLFGNSYYPRFHTAGAQKHGMACPESRSYQVINSKRKARCV